MRTAQHLTMAVIGGLLYVGVELVWRGRSHASMFFVGGFCFWAVGMLDRIAPGLPLAAQAVLGAVLITAAELITGLVLNVGLALRVWDYSGCSLNFLGQICLPYSLLWIPLALGAALADDVLRLWLFRQPLPVYRWLL